jgi:hypothetical protein
VILGLALGLRRYGPKAIEAIVRGRATEPETTVGL